MVIGLTGEDNSFVLEHSREYPQAGHLNRFSGNPVLEPIPEHSWESRYVLNSAAISLNDKVYMLYRAFGDDEISRIGLAISDDGFVFNERIESPVFEPGEDSERAGCEDARVALIEDRIYMVYTAWDGDIYQIAMASIEADDFIGYRWDRWHRHGLFNPGIRDKDAAIFPERFDGKFAILHRIAPDIWLAFSPDLNFPCAMTEDMILAKPTPGQEWDSSKIGAGAQPIKTEYGWLLITHGVSHDKVYRLGVMLVDLRDPTRLIYRSPNSILGPETEYELGIKDESWVPNVVFTCGAVPLTNHKEFLSADDELIVYYGGADSVMNVATAKIGELIPEEIRFAS